MRAARGHLDGLMLRVAFLDALAAEHSASQVVIVGAGLDTRAWRLTSLRGVRVFEVDHPATQAYKREGVARLPAPLAQVSFVPVDFTRDALEAALGSAGHNPSLPTLWIWEGVIMYLDDAALRGTLAALRRMSSSGSTLLAHYHEPDPKTDPTGSVVMRKLVLRWLGEPQIGMRSRDQMRSELERAGFAVLQDAGVVEQAERVGGSAPTIAVSRVSRVAVARG
jgi:methyltransferase (TIGR00027 family)